MHKARADALRLLRFRPRSVKEMAQRLKQKGHRGIIIARAIDELEAKKLLDDRIFAKLWIGDRISLKPSGKSLIVRELRAKGLDEETISAAFAEYEGLFDEAEIAGPLIRRKIAGLKGLDPERAKKRIFDFLSRRGFSANTIWKLIKENYDYGPAEE
ncbi:MAG: regulatory protein RecX [Candidatus Omnitrophota bacterium]